MKSTEIIEWAGETLHLMPEKAIWWEREKTVLIADPHFGKASAFRFAGIPVPETTHDDDLEKLSAILDKTAATRLVILGDFFHARTGWTAPIFDTLVQWRERHLSVEMILVEGNHDRHSGRFDSRLRIECVHGSKKIGPFHCVHEPIEIPECFVLAGHVHPSFYLKDRAGSGLDQPCFYFGQRLAILPAFGSFTGTHCVKAGKGDRIFAVGPEAVIDVSAAVKI